MWTEEGENELRVLFSRAIDAPQNDYDAKFLCACRVRWKQDDYTELFSVSTFLPPFEDILWNIE